MRFSLQFILLIECFIYCNARLFPNWIPNFYGWINSSKKPAPIVYPTDWGKSANGDETAKNVGDNLQACVCVPDYLCDKKSKTVIIDGTNIVDYRFKQSNCGIDEVCCYLVNDPDDPDSPISPSTPSFPEEPKSNVVDSEFPSKYQDCGKRSSSYELKLSHKVSGDFDDTATDEGDHPWALVLNYVDQTPDGPIQILGCGATLIHPAIAITAAHCVRRKAPEQLSLSAGEYDLNSAAEVNPVQIRNVIRKILHPKFSSVPIRYDVALLLVDHSFKKNDAVNTICLPTLSDFSSNKWSECVGVGWGSSGKEIDVIGPKHTLKKASMSMVPQELCERQLRKTKLGTLYSLHKSFLCAGGESEIDTCKGDGGGPFTCSDDDGRNFLVGITSWGVAGGCGKKGIPGMYTNVAEMYDWIRSATEEIMENYT